MNYIVGSAVKICCKIDQDLVATTTISLESLFDPDGNEIISTQSMDYDAVITNMAVYVWQSTNGVDPIGRYEYVVKCLNGTTESYAKGYFFLEAR